MKLILALKAKDVIFQNKRRFTNGVELPRLLSCSRLCVVKVCNCFCKQVDIVEPILVFMKLEAPPTIGLSHRLENDWEVPRHMLRLTKKLGEGHFGHVYEALFSEVLKVAVKSLKRSKSIFCVLF